MGYINKFMSGWWNAFDGFYSQLCDTNPSLAENTALAFLREAGIKKSEIKSALKTLTFFQNTENFLIINLDKFN